MTYTTSYSLSTERSAFAANTYTYGDQAFRELRPLSGGGFVVGYDTLLDFWGPDFAHAGGYVVTAGFIEKIAAYDNGNVVVLTRDSSNNDFVQIFNSVGVQLGTTHDIYDRVASNTSSLLALNNGSFVVVESNYSAQYDFYGTGYDVYDSSGNVVIVGSVSTQTGRPQFSSADLLSNGDFVVLNDQYIKDGGIDLHFSIIGPDGHQKISDVAIAGIGTDDEYYDPVVAGMPDGGFAVAYRYNDDNGNNYKISLRVYDENGTEVGSPQVVGSIGSFTPPQIAVLENGFIAVGWEEIQGGQLVSLFSIFDSEGAPVPGLPSHVVYGHPASATDPSPDLSALLSGQLFLASTDTSIDGSGNGVAVTVEALVRTSYGTDEGEAYTGDDLDEIIAAGGGADLVVGFGGRDTIYGDAGEDFLAGNQGDDLIHGGEDDDDLYGYEDNDTLYGDAGNDTVGGGIGNDAVNGGEGNDSVSGDDGNDTVVGEGGADALSGGAGQDRLDGGSGHDTLTGGDGSDTYVLVGLSPVGTFPIRYAVDEVIEGRGAGSGVDTVLVQSGGGKFDIRAYTLTDNVENGVVTGTAAFTLTGNQIDNTLTGSDGTDTLNGVKGHDTLKGGNGNDTYILNDTDGANFVYDTVIEGATGGADTVFVRGLANHGYKLTDNVENGTITGKDTSFQLEGNALGNALVSGKGSDRLIGGAGLDLLTGGGGNDRFLYQDIVTGVAGGWGKDEITDFKRGEDLIDFAHASAVHRFRDLSITDDHGVAVIATGHGDTIRLDGVNAAALRANDFIFATSAAPGSTPTWQAAPDYDLGAHCYLA